MNTKLENSRIGVEASKTTNIVLWVIQVGLAVMFVMAGWSKLSGNPQMIGLFQAIGIGQWFRYFTGGMELGGAVLLLVPRLSVFGALLLAATMSGAVLTHLFLIGGNPTLPIILLAFSAFVAWARRGRIVQMLNL